MHAVPGLACPACRGDLRADGEATLTCETCGAAYRFWTAFRSIFALPYKDAAFDRVICSEVIEHVSASSSGYWSRVID